MPDAPRRKLDGAVQVGQRAVDIALIGCLVAGTGGKAPIG